MCAYFCKGVHILRGEKKAHNEKTPAKRRALNLFGCLQLDRAGNLARAQAARASVHSFRRAVYNRFHSFYIGLPSSVGASVRVRNFDAERDIFTAEFTFSHYEAPPFVQ